MATGGISADLFITGGQGTSGFGGTQVPGTGGDAPGPFGGKGGASVGGQAGGGPGAGGACGSSLIALPSGAGANGIIVIMTRTRP